MVDVNDKVVISVAGAVVAVVGLLVDELVVVGARQE